MRIAFVDEDLSPRTGSRRFTCEVARHLQSRGHEIEIFTTKLDTRRCFRGYLGMPIHVVPGKIAVSSESTYLSPTKKSELLKTPIEFAYLLRQARNALKISESIANEQCDAVLLQYHGEHWLPPYFYHLSKPISAVYLNVVQLMPRPFALPFQELPLNRRIAGGLYDSLPIRGLEKASLGKLSTFLAPSKFQLEQARKQRIIGQKKTGVIPLGVDHDRFYPVNRSEGFALYLGRINPHKSLELAVMAMKKTPESCSLIIAGDIEPRFLWYKSHLINLASESFQNLLLFLLVTP